MGDLLPSSGNRYLSFWRRTFETVLYRTLVQNCKSWHEALGAWLPSLYSKHSYSGDNQYLRMITYINIFHSLPPISVCFTVGLSS